MKETTRLNRIRIINRNDVADFCKQYLSPLPIENVCIIALDTGNNIIGYEALEGATNQCAIYPTNVFRFLLSAAATSFIISHNHPGGSSRPSEADWNITERLQSIGKMLEIPLLDHILITENDCISLRENSRWNQN
ncbi:MAG: JAB domain-containing protein [Chitinivibrionales bacterium]|nr:JAB domain-containing protein [Chitinivibrionales bacterium]